MQNIMVGLIVAIILLIMLFPLWLLIKVGYSNKEKVSEKATEKKRDNFVSMLKSKKIISTEKQDIRSLSFGEQKTTDAFIDENNNFFKSPESKELQNTADELFLKVVENAKKKITEQHQNEHMKRSLKSAKDAQNSHQLKKLSNQRTRKKVAKIVAKKNIELDDEKIKKIKIKAAGKSR